MSFLEVKLINYILCVSNFCLFVKIIAESQLLSCRQLIVCSAGRTDSLFRKAYRRFRFDYGRYVPAYGPHPEEEQEAEPPEPFEYTED